MNGASFDIVMFPGVLNEESLLEDENSIPEIDEPNTELEISAELSIEDANK